MRDSTSQSRFLAGTFNRAAISRVCKCRHDMSSEIFSPLAAELPGRRNPGLEYLQVKWAAHLPYAVATALFEAGSV